MRGTRPDICYDVIEMSTKLKEGKVDDLIRVNKVINQLKEGGATVFYPYMGSVETWDLLVVSDASFANMSDGVSSCGGHIILIVGEQSKCCVIAWMSKKIKRVVRSTLAAEMLSLTEALEHAIYLKKISSEVLNGPALNIFAVVDNKSVVDAIFSTKSVDGKRLRVDVGGVKEMINDRIVTSVRWIPGCEMLADVLTKRGVEKFSILNMLRKGKCNIRYK